MKRKISGAVAVALLLFGGAFPAWAQLVAPISDNFDVGPSGGFQLAGWVTDPPSISGSEWKCDALPATVLGGPATFGGSLASLNFNDDTGYYDSESGSATSPAIDVTGLGGSVVLQFACNYDTETNGYLFDTRDIEILNGATDAPLAPALLLATDFTWGGDIACAAEGTMHTHSVDITAIVGATPTIKIRFNFSADSSVDGFAGWFVDNFAVTCADAITPTVPIQLSPPDAGWGISPITLDWTDSTDTTACGVGTIASYTLQVDTDPLFPAPVILALGTSTATGTATPGLYYWRVMATDAAGNSSAWSATWSFNVELAMAPLAADTLFVNESAQGAQGGRGGFVDPVVDEYPVFSAIYRDANHTDSAIALEFQVSRDPTFVVVDIASPILSILPNLVKDGRCPDLTIATPLDKDTIYYWRIRFTDAGALVGAWSTAQAFHIGDDYDFGARPGSKNHSKKCFVATAAWGGVTPEVSGLMAFRSGVLESSPAGRTFSRGYSALGPGISSRLTGHGGVRMMFRGGLTPLASAAAAPVVTGTVTILALALLLALAIRRMS